MKTSVWAIKIEEIKMVFYIDFYTIFFYGKYYYVKGGTECYVVPMTTERFNFVHKFWYMCYVLQISQHPRI